MTYTSKMLLAALACASLGLGTAACSGDDNTQPGTGTNKDAGTSPTDSGTTPGNDTGTTPGTDGGADAADAAPFVLPTGMIDRMGRPAINTALNYGDDVKKDSFNHTETFAASALTTWDTNFETNLELFDKLDTVNQWTPDGGTHPLRDPLKLDVLIVDTSKSCTTATNGYCEGGYLEIESQLLLGGPTHTTCGGRTPPQDVIDVTLSLLAIKATSGVSDNVSSATKPPTRTFPYLADKN